MKNKIKKLKLPDTYSEIEGWSIRDIQYRLVQFTEKFNEMIDRLNSQDD